MVNKTYFLQNITSENITCIILKNAWEIKAVLKYQQYIL